MTDFLCILPLMIIGLGGIALMLLAALDKLPHSYAATAGMVVFGLGFLVQLLGCPGGDVDIYGSIFNSMLVGNSFTKVAGLIITGCGFFTCMMSKNYFQNNRFLQREFYSLTAFAACGMLLLTMAHELITAFIALEIMSLAIYVLVGMNRKDLRATEAIFKYLVLGAFAGGFFTMGTALIYGAVGSTNFGVIGGYIAAKSPSSSAAFVAGGFFIVVSLLFKVAAFPFHAWVVDVYDGASMPVTGFMATALKTAVFALFANFLVVDSGLQNFWLDYLFYIAVFTMFGGNLIAIGQNSLKRMLAASGIVHTGYLLIALVAFTTKDFTFNVILYYLAAYAAGTLGIFAALSYLSGDNEKRQNFEDFKGLAKVRPYSAAAISIFLLSMAGIPPTAGFMGKLYIIVNAIDAGQIVLAILGIVSSVLSMWYYLRLIITMYFHEPGDEFTLTGSTLAPLCTFILAVCVFVIGLIPIGI